MKILVYLMTLVLFSTAVAQNPTILTGNYITNVFGNSNFILNPNAQTGLTNVTTVTATVTRSTTTPLVATSEFTVAIGTANGTATWATRAFDAGMKGQNCEARFTYRGFAATSKVHIKQGANTVASLNLTPATDPRIASINFPCGDLSAATTFVVTDTAILAGTNEIGGIYTGLATNQANVAQAEFVGAFTLSSAANCNFLTSSTSYVAFTSPDADCPTPTVEGSVAAVVGQEKTPQFTVNAQKPGRYFIIATVNLQKNGTVGAPISVVLTDGTDQSAPTSINPPNVNGANIANQHTFNWTTSGTRTIQLKFATFNASNTLVVANDTPSHGFLRADVYRFPTSSELVVTPERQNTFAAGQWTGGISFGRSSTAEITISNAVFSTNRTLFGKAEFTTTANDVAIKVPQMPPGTYRIELTGNFANYLNTAGTLDSNCSFFLKDGTNTAVARSQQYGSIFQKDSVSTATAIVKYTSTADRTFTASLASGTANNTECLVFEPKIIITPLDQPSNSALYVQGPILGAQTGATIGAGYVGEVKSSVVTTGVNMTSVNWTEVTNLSVTLTPGVWMVQATGYWNKNGATMSAYQTACALGSSSGDVSANYAATKFYRVRTAQEMPETTTILGHSLNIRPFYVRSDGTNLYFSDGTTFLSSSQTIKMACYSGQFSAGNPLVSGVIEAVRVN